MPRTRPSTKALESSPSHRAHASEFILPLWRNVAIHHKQDGTEVTEADLGAEQLMRRRIADRYPTHAILGEEYGGEKNFDADHLWLLDPIDGTSSFAVGLPLFGTLIGYLRKGQPAIGIIATPALGETVYASIGSGCWYRKDSREPERIQTSGATRLTEAVVRATGLETTNMDPRQPDPSVNLGNLFRQAMRFRWGGDCINYSLLCQGRIDVALDPRMHPWDIAALAPCVREAGGVLTSLDGNEDIVWQKNLVASATPALHADVLQALRPAAA